MPWKDTVKEKGYLLWVKPQRYTEKLRGSKGKLFAMTFRCCQAVYKSLEVTHYMTDVKGPSSDHTP